MIRILTPLLLLGGIWFVTNQALNTVEAATESYRAELDERVANIQDDVSAASDALSSLTAFAVGARDAVSNQLVAIRQIGNLEIPLPTVPVVNYNIPDIDVSIPGSAALKRVAADFDAAGAAIGDSIDDVTAIAQVPGEVRAMADQSVNYATDLRDTVVRWAKIIATLFAVSLAVFIGGRVARVVTEFRRGWSMFRTGVDIKADTVADLFARVTELERRLTTG